MPCRACQGGGCWVGPQALGSCRPPCTARHPPAGICGTCCTACAPPASYLPHAFSNACVISPTVALRAPRAGKERRLNSGGQAGMPAAQPGRRLACGAGEAAATGASECGSKPRHAAGRGGACLSRAASTASSSRLRSRLPLCASSSRATRAAATADPSRLARTLWMGQGGVEGRHRHGGCTAQGGNMWSHVLLRCGAGHRVYGTPRPNWPLQTGSLRMHRTHRLGAGAPLPLLL